MSNAITEALTDAVNVLDRHFVMKVIKNPEHSRMICRCGHAWDVDARSLAPQERVHNHAMKEIFSLESVRAIFANMILEADYDRSPSYGYSERDIAVAQEAIRDAAKVILDTEIGEE